MCSPDGSSPEKSAKLFRCVLLGHDTVEASTEEQVKAEVNAVLPEATFREVGYTTFVYLNKDQRPIGIVLEEIDLCAETA